MQTGDRMVIRYSGAAEGRTMCSDWTSDTTPYTIADGTITLNGRGAPSRNDQSRSPPTPSLRRRVQPRVRRPRHDQGLRQQHDHVQLERDHCVGSGDGILTVTIGTRTSARPRPP